MIYENVIEHLGSHYSTVCFCKIDSAFDMECDVLYVDDEVVNNLCGNRITWFDNLQTQLVKQGTKIIKAYRY